jgi:hypothetical protein
MREPQRRVAHPSLGPGPAGRQGTHHTNGKRAVLYLLSLGFGKKVLAGSVFTPSPSASVPPAGGEGGTDAGAWHTGRLGMTCPRRRPLHDVPRRPWWALPASLAGLWQAHALSRKS